MSCIMSPSLLNMSTLRKPASAARTLVMFANASLMVKATALKKFCGSLACSRP